MMAQHNVMERDAMLMPRMKLVLRMMKQSNDGYEM
jgi:hypothetical protein